MKFNNITNDKKNKIKDIIMFILLLLWFLIPVLKSFYKTFFIVSKYNFSLMYIIGIVGIVVYLGYLIKKEKENSNLKKTIYENLPVLIFSLYMVWTLISCFLSPDKELAFYGTWYRQEGYFTYLTYAGFFLCAFLLDSKKLRKILLNIFLIVTLFLIGASLILEKHINLIGILMVSDVKQSVFWQFNHYGYYLMLSLMCSFGLFLTEKNKILKVIYIIIFSIIGYILIRNNTFGCYLATSIVLIIFLIYSLIKKKYRVLTIIAIAIFAIMSCFVKQNGKVIEKENFKTFVFDIKSIASKITNKNLNDKNNSNKEKNVEKKEENKKVEQEQKEINTEENKKIEQEKLEKKQKEEQEQIEKNFNQAGTTRMKLWKNAFNFFLERPIIGYGPENLETKFKSVKITDQDRPHNLLLQLATTSGIPGLILYISAVGIIVIRGIKNLKKDDENNVIFLVIVLTYLISAMFGNSMYYTSPYFFIFLGFLYKCTITKK